MLVQLLAAALTKPVGPLKVEALQFEFPPGERVELIGELNPRELVFSVRAPANQTQRSLYLNTRRMELPEYAPSYVEELIGVRQGVIVSRVRHADYHIIPIVTRHSKPPFEVLNTGTSDRGLKSVGVWGEVMSWYAAPGSQDYAGANHGRIFFLYDSPKYAYPMFREPNERNPNPGYPVVSLGSRFFASTHLAGDERLGITLWDEAINATHVFAPRGYDGLVAEAVSRTGDVAGRALAKGKDDLYVKRKGQKPLVIPAPKWAMGGRLVAQEFLSDGTLVGTLERDNEKSTEVWVVRGRTLTRLVGNTSPLKITWAQYVGLGYDEKSFLVRVGLGGSKWGWARIRP